MAETVNRISQLLGSFISEESLTTVQTSPAVSSSTICPFNQEKYFERISTYSSSTWFAKPLWLSPLVCARYGFINTARDLLKCVTCKANASGQLPTSTKPAIVEACHKRLLDQLVSAHTSTCPWGKCPSPDNFGELSLSGHEETVNTFRERSLQLVAAGNQLPVFTQMQFDSMGMDKDILHTLVALVSDWPDCCDEWKEVIVALVVTGWVCSGEKDAATMCCSLCSRHIGFWNFHNFAEKSSLEQAQERDERCLDSANTICEMSDNPTKIDHTQEHTDSPNTPEVPDKHLISPENVHSENSEDSVDPSPEGSINPNPADNTSEHSLNPKPDDNLSEDPINPKLLDSSCEYPSSQATCESTLLALSKDFETSDASDTELLSLGPLGLKVNTVPDALSDSEKLESVKVDETGNDNSLKVSEVDAINNDSTDNCKSTLEVETKCDITLTSAVESDADTSIKCHNFESIPKDTIQSSALPSESSDINTNQECLGIVDESGVNSLPFDNIVSDESSGVENVDNQYGILKTDPDNQNAAGDSTKCNVNTKVTNNKKNVDDTEEKISNMSKSDSEGTPNDMPELNLHIDQELYDRVDVKEELSTELDQKVADLNNDHNIDDSDTQEMKTDAEIYLKRANEELENYDKTLTEGAELSCDGEEALTPVTNQQTDDGIEEPKKKKQKKESQVKKKEIFDPQGEHRIWCPWVAKSCTDEAAWKKVVYVLLPQYSPHKSLSTFVRTTPKHKSLRTIRKLLCDAMPSNEDYS